jgi:hypothetical protein
MTEAAADLISRDELFVDKVVQLLGESMARLYARPDRSELGSCLLKVSGQYLVVSVDDVEDLACLYLQSEATGPLPWQHQLN